MEENIPIRATGDCPVEKNRRFEYAKKHLTELGIPFVVTSEWQFSLLVDERFDFWPSRGSWNDRKSKARGRREGIREFLKQYRRITGK